MSVHETAQLRRVPRLHSLADERGETEALHKDVVHLLGAGEQLGYDVEIWAYAAGFVEDMLRHVERCRVAVVDPEPGEVLG